jgi:two-component system sensor histidine kinase/response regulator
VCRVCGHVAHEPVLHLTLPDLSPLPPVPDGAGRATILVVDRESSIRALVRACLAEEGYRVVCVPRPEDALVALAAARFALVLTGTFADPVVGDPWATVGRIRAAAGNIPVFIFTAHAPDLFADFHERGFAGVIAKPFDLDELFAAVAHQLRARSRCPRDVFASLPR